MKGPIECNATVIGRADLTDALATFLIDIDDPGVIEPLRARVQAVLARR